MDTTFQNYVLTAANCSFFVKSRGSAISFIHKKTEEFIPKLWPHASIYLLFIITERAGLYPVFRLTITQTRNITKIYTTFPAKCIFRMTNKLTKSPPNWEFNHSVFLSRITLHSKKYAAVINNPVSTIP